MSARLDLLGAALNEDRIVLRQYHVTDGDRVSPLCLSPPATLVVAAVGLTSTLGPLPAGWTSLLIPDTAQPGIHPVRAADAAATRGVWACTATEAYCPPIRVRGASRLLMVEFAGASELSGETVARMLGLGDPPGPAPR